MNKFPRCMLLFENACRSPKTFRDYKIHLDKFLKWSHKDYQSALLLTQTELESLLQDYCIYLKRRTKEGNLNPNSVAYFFNGIFKFLRVNQRTFNAEVITQLYPERVKLSGEKAITTEQCQILLDSTGDKREKALVHFFSATGARPEAVCNLQLKHIQPHSDGYLKVVLYSDDKHEMITFLHPEASNAIENYLDERRNKGEQVTRESYLFRSNVKTIADMKSKPMSLQTLEGIMLRLWKASGIKRVKKGRNYDLKATGAFRKRFDTVLEFNPDVSMGATQYLMDHTGYMSGYHYRRPTVEQVFEAYRKATPQLMISEIARKDLENKEIKTKNLENNDKILFLEKRLENTERLLIELKNRLDSKDLR